MQRTGHILVFDSGLGGTTILAELHKKLPNCRYSYLMDNAAFPYGGRPDDYLIARGQQIFATILAQLTPDIVVIACNTASTLFLDILRKNHPDIAFIGVVPAIKPAAKLSQTRTIGLLATPATIHRSYIDKLEQEFAEDCRMVRLAHPDIALLAEQKMRTGVMDSEQLQLILHDLQLQPFAQAIDVMVLGCTHFPAIQQELASCWSKSITWIDSGAAIAQRAEQLLSSRLANEATISNHLCLTDENDAIQLLRHFGAFGIESYSILEI